MNKPSIVPRSHRKPTCDSMPIFFISSPIRATRTEDKIFEEMSNKQIPRQFLHKDKSPFLDRSTRRAINHESYTTSPSLPGNGPNTRPTGGAKRFKKPWSKLCLKSADLAPCASASLRLVHPLYASYRSNGQSTLCQLFWDYLVET